MKPATTPNIDPSFFTQQNWDYLSAVGETCEDAKGLMESLKNNLPKWKELLGSPNFVLEKLP
jgi:hypothetical protein